MFLFADGQNRWSARKVSGDLRNVLGAQAEMAEQIPGSEYYATLPEVTERLRQLARPGDLILTVGAGDIYTVGEALTEA